MDSQEGTRDDPLVDPNPERECLAHAGTRRGAARASGLAVLVGIVVLGLLTGAGLYRYQRRAQDERLTAELARAPKDPAERLALWLHLVGPQIHHRLAVVGRFTSEMPWLVTHAVSDGAGPPELYGVDCAKLPKDLAHLEGLVVVVELPAPVVLGRVALEGEAAHRVPLYATVSAPHASERLSALALYLLEDMPRALERDVPGASLRIHVADP
jgi:hypothetical protein